MQNFPTYAYQLLESGYAGVASGVWGICRVHWKDKSRRYMIAGLLSIIQMLLLLRNTLDNLQWNIRAIVSAGIYGTTPAQKATDFSLHYTINQKKTHIILRFSERQFANQEQEDIIATVANLSNENYYHYDSAEPQKSQSFPNGTILKARQSTLLFSLFISALPSPGHGRRRQRH